MAPNCLLTAPDLRDRDRDNVGLLLHCPKGDQKMATMKQNNRITKQPRDKTPNTIIVAKYHETKNQVPKKTS